VHGALLVGQRGALASRSVQFCEVWRRSLCPEVAQPNPRCHSMTIFSLSCPQQGPWVHNRAIVIGHIDCRVWEHWSGFNWLLHPHH
jgi:hypothetical protein